MADIEAGKVNCVVVYKVDRLSRSLLDFARMMETFDRYQVAFVSVTQAFNTSTSMGRLVLNVLLSFAQFERRSAGSGSGTRSPRPGARGNGLADNRPWVTTSNPAPSNRDQSREAEQVRAIFDLYSSMDRCCPWWRN